MKSTCCHGFNSGKLSTYNPTFPQHFQSYPQFVAQESLGVGQMKTDRRSFDPQRHSQQTQARLIVAGLALLFIVGGGLVWLLYGDVAAVSTVACLSVAAGLMGLLWLMLVLLERWVEKD